MTNNTRAFTLFVLQLMVRMQKSQGNTWFTMTFFTAVRMKL